MRIKTLTLYAHMIRMCKFFPRMIRSLVERRQSADKFGATEYKLFYLVVYVTWSKIQNQTTETLQVMKMHISQTSSVFISILQWSTALTHRRWIFHSVRAAMKWWNAQTRHVHQYEYYIRGLQRCWQFRYISCSKQGFCLYKIHVRQNPPTLKFNYYCWTPSYSLFSLHVEVYILLNVYGFIKHVLTC